MYILGLHRTLLIVAFAASSSAVLAADPNWSHQFKFELETKNFDSCGTSALRANSGSILNDPNPPRTTVGFSFPVEGVLLKGIATQLPGGFASVALFGTGAREPQRVKMILPKVLYDLSVQIRESCQRVGL